MYLWVSKEWEQAINTADKLALTFTMMYENKMSSSKLATTKSGEQINEQLLDKIKEMMERQEAYGKK